MPGSPVRSRALAAAVGVALLAGGCDALPTGARPATPSVGSTSPAVRSAPAPSPSASPSASGRARTQAQLRRALLAPADVPSGFVVAEDSDLNDVGGATSSRPACRKLVGLTNANDLPGSVARAGVTLSWGDSGPYVDENLDAMTSTAAAADFVDSYREAVRDCDAISFAIAGAGESILDARKISWADLGDDTFALRLRAASGALRGLELLHVVVQADDVVVGMTFLGMRQGDAEAAAADAVAKVRDKLARRGA